MSITLHPKFGLNPSLGQCFWCGGDSGEVLILGYNKNREAPRKMVASYAPCPKCVEDRAKGITLIACVPARGADQHKRAITKLPEPLVPTGDWMVLTERAIKWMLESQPALLAQVLEHRAMFTEPAVLQRIRDDNPDLFPATPDSTRH